MAPIAIILAFDELLSDRGLSFDAVIIGAAIAPTRDELLAAWPFVVQYERNEESPQVYWMPATRRQSERLGKELGHDVVL